MPARVRVQEVGVGGGPGAASAFEGQAVFAGPPVQLVRHSLLTARELGQSGLLEEHGGFFEGDGVRDRLGVRVRGDGGDGHVFSQIDGSSSQLTAADTGCSSACSSCGEGVYGLADVAGYDPATPAQVAQSRRLFSMAACSYASSPSFHSRCVPWLARA